jgi:RimJ/RimL family protein N-acetyltransferase
MLRHTPREAHDQVVHVSPRSGRRYVMRVATLADRDALADVYLTCRRHTFTWVDPSQYQRTDFIEDTDGERVLVCEFAGQIVGFSGVWLQDSFLHHLFIVEAHQGQGAGLGLLRTTMRDIPGPVRLKCVVQNERALRFYTKLGGVIEATSEDGPEGPYHSMCLPNPLRLGG